MNKKCYNCKMSGLCVINKIFTEKLSYLISVKDKPRNAREEVYSVLAECCDLYEKYDESQNPTKEGDQP